jgi:hypothetical protein
MTPQASRMNHGALRIPRHMMSKPPASSRKPISTWQRRARMVTPLRSGLGIGVSLGAILNS